MNSQPRSWSAGVLTPARAGARLHVCAPPTCEDPRGTGVTAARWVQVWDAWDGPRAFYHDVVEDDETMSKSLLFNAFIFMQVFNEINSRKILDEYNIFSGIHKSPIFLGVLLVTAVLQVIIVQTPVSAIFHVHPLNGVSPHPAWPYNCEQMPSRTCYCMPSRHKCRTAWAAGIAAPSCLLLRAWPAALPT